MGLFGKLPMKIIGVTGSVSSGKSRFCLGIDPESRNMDGPAKTVVFDAENSTDLYTHIYNFDRIDLYQHPDFKGKTGAALWQAMIDWWEKCPEGKYRVAIFDDNWLIEQCVDEWVAANPEHFGKTSGQYQKMSAIKGADVKGYLQNFVLGTICTKVEVFAFTAHERMVWKNDKPTRNTRPYGKTTWKQLAHLYLKLEIPVEPGKTKQDPVPRAYVEKTRLCSASGDPVLPPAFKNASADRIREFIEDPANWQKLKKEEVIPKEILTDEEKQDREAEILDKRLEVAQAQQEMLRMQAAAKSSVLDEYAAAAKQPPTKEQAAAVATESQPPAPTVDDKPDDMPGSNGLIKPESVASIITAAKLIEAKKPGFWEAFKKGIAKYTANQTGMPHDIQQEFFPRIWGRLNEVAEGLSIDLGE